MTAKSVPNGCAGHDGNLDNTVQITIPTLGLERIAMDLIFAINAAKDFDEGRPQCAVMSIVAQSQRKRTIPACRCRRQPGASTVR
jgi:hypothetical protein